MQPIAGYQVRRLNAAGTVALSPNPTVLRGVHFNSATQDGTVTIHDNASGTAGTATQYFVVTAREGGTVPSYLGQINVNMRNGLVVETTGTNDITVTWG